MYTTTRNALGTSQAPMLYGWDNNSDISPAIVTESMFNPPYQRGQPPTKLYVSERHLAFVDTVFNHFKRNGSYTHQGGQESCPVHLQFEFSWFRGLQSTFHDTWLMMCKGRGAPHQQGDYNIYMGVSKNPSFWL